MLVAFLRISAPSPSAIIIRVAEKVPETAGDVAPMVSIFVLKSKRPNVKVSVPFTVVFAPKITPPDLLIVKLLKIVVELGISTPVVTPVVPV